MTDINKEFSRVFTAHALYHNPQLLVIDKTLQPLSTDQAIAKIKALVVEARADELKTLLINRPKKDRIDPETVAERLNQLVRGD